MKRNLRELIEAVRSKAESSGAWISGGIYMYTYIESLYFETKVKYQTADLNLHYDIEEEDLHVVRDDLIATIVAYAEMLNKLEEKMNENS